MFNKDKKIEMPGPRREYLDMLPAFNKEVLHFLSQPFIEDTSTLELVIEISKVKYDICGPDPSSSRKTELLEKLRSYGIHTTMRQYMDKAVTRGIQSPDELARFLDGVSCSFRLKEEEQKALREELSKFPELIFCRMLELMDLDQ
ncbi:hypothetical protein [Vibrio phage vB_VmeM-Yong XC32]|nr:hypothetical protein [Vibrio phage vB_VmeM-Yong XC31]QAX96460.1 hypothetical protein [Vibrio phage vB_VmeM-Yong XC32]QAX96777.1 hypothetical protein [Vibrio phage vB_VmeM-Yong MS31]QAX97096.1 hypothetical protein [Vibrio phage vB_VmeM-Yong MS32]